MASIREAGARTLQKVAGEFGAEWARDHLVPHVLGLIKNPHYLYRMTVLVALSMLATIVSQDVLCNLMLPVITTAAKDKVGRGSRGGGWVGGGGAAAHACRITGVDGETWLGWDGRVCSARGRIRGSASLTRAPQSYTFLLSHSRRHGRFD